MPNQLDDGIADTLALRGIRRNLSLYGKRFAGGIELRLLAARSVSQRVWKLCRVRNEAEPTECEFSLAVKRRIDGFNQSRVSERLEQAFCRTLLDEPLAKRRISVGGNEDNRDGLSSSNQFPLKIRPGHPRHSDIDDKTSGLVNVVGCEERLRRGERLGRISELSQQVGQRLAHGFIVVDHGYD